MPRLPRSPAFWYAAFAVAFVACRVALFAFTAAAEYNLYKDYGDTAREQGLGELYRTRNVEYPQLAVVFGALAGTIGDSIPEWASHLRDLRPDPARGEEGSRYEVGLGIVLFAVDVSCLLLVFGIARRIYPHEGPAARVARLAAYTALTGAVGLIFYDRQDPVVAWCALLAILAFLEGRTPLAYAVLVAGTAFKLVPALLLPVFVFAAAAVRAGPGATPGRYARAVVREAAVAAVLLALWPVLTYWLGGGDRAFGYLTYHSARGLQLEAPLGWLMLLVDPTGTEVGHSFGGYTLRGELPDRVAKVCSVAMALGAGLAALASVRGFRRLMSRPDPPAPFPKKEGGERQPAGLSPSLPRGGVGEGSSAPAALGPHLVAASLLVWMVFIVTNKVGSPQFMLWVGPLAPLLPLRTWASWVWAALLLVACGLSTVIFPCAYPSVIGRHLHDDPSTWAGPVPWAHFILAVKAVILAVVTLWLAAWVWRSPGPAAPPAPEPTP
jgi:hypothetical protein